MSSEKPDPAAAAESVLTAFVRRARRVEAHSLMQDKQQMVAWANGSMKIRQRMDGGLAEFEWEVPPEEPFESLAARVRPVTLEGESVHWAKVMNALGYVAREDADLSETIKEQREQWKKITSRKEAVGQFIRSGEVGGELGEPVADVDIAHSWLYGDLVHADEHDVAAGMELKYRYQIAVPIYGSAAILTVVALRLIEIARDRQLVTIPDEAFETKPAVTLPLIQTGRALIGTPDMSIADLEAAMDALPPLPPDTEDTKGQPD